MVWVERGCSAMDQRINADRTPTVWDAIIEVREHEVVVDADVLAELTEAEEPGRASGMVKPGFPVRQEDYEGGRYDEYDRAGT